jgi:hypothetical protein
MIETLHNGFPLDRFTPPSPIFQMGSGLFKLGDQGEGGGGFRGWIDELKVLVHNVSAEVACNHAQGTLIQVDDNPQWEETARLYPEWAHVELTQALERSRPESDTTPSSSLFACFHNYQSDYAAHLKNRPEGTLGLRDALIFPEGPIRADLPRPDSSQNAFCLSCHHAAGKGGMGLEALELKPHLTAEIDPRRQPNQPPRRVFGNIPAHWIEGSPDTALQAPSSGIIIDRWIQ